MCISAVLTYATNELELIQYNPMSKVKTVPKPNGRKRFLLHEEINKLLPACKEESQKVYLFTLIALATGGRYSEILHLKLENIDYKNSRVYYLDTKNDESRGVYLEPQIMEFLKQYCADNNITDYIFRGRIPNQLSYVRGKLYKIFRKLKIEDFTIHDMRHTFASYAAMNGASLLDIAELLGQKTLVMARRYSHLTVKHTDSIVKKAVSEIIPCI